MKPILFLLALGLLSTSSLCVSLLPQPAQPVVESKLNKTAPANGMPAKGAYQEVTIYAPLDGMYSDLYLFAQEELVPRLQTEKGTSANLKFDILPNKIYLQVAAGFNVKFDADFEDRVTKKNYNTVFTVFYQPWTGFKRLVSVSHFAEKTI